jgi:hypothetical protein
MTNFRWIVNGNPFVRNPDDYSIKPLTPNVTYSIESSGRQVRTQSRKLLSANQLQLDWHYADERLRRAISILTQTSSLSKVVIVGTKPTISVWAYLDTVALTMSKDIVDKKPGNAGHRRDLTLTGNTDGPYYHSFFPVPPDLSVNPVYVQNSFLGQTQSSSFDTIPNWNGNAWNQQLVLNNFNRISNMGTAEWSPIIRINGPFSSIVLNMRYEDVDGTGAGVNFTWLGNPLGASDFLLIDTDSMRVFLSNGGAPIDYTFASLRYFLPPINEVHTFSLTARSTGIPFPYWPPAPMGEFVVTPLALTGNSSATSIDYSNNGTETFRYR